MEVPIPPRADFYTQLGDVLLERARHYQAPPPKFNVLFAIWMLDTFRVETSGGWVIIVGTVPIWRAGTCKICIQPERRPRTDPSQLDYAHCFVVSQLSAFMSWFELPRKRGESAGLCTFRIKQFLSGVGAKVQHFQSNCFSFSGLNSDKDRFRWMSPFHRIIVWHVLFHFF